ncbi:hypothetical protein F5X98DRAFT_232695 [Xylaria grammica]|nr:hypothetical protein F5X98DRAFT_232695 [Xylaria grammica]
MTSPSLQLRILSSWQSDGFRRQRPQQPIKASASSTLPTSLDLTLHVPRQANMCCISDGLSPCSTAVGQPFGDHPRMRQWSPNGLMRHGLESDALACDAHGTRWSSTREGEEERESSSWCVAQRDGNRNSHCANDGLKNVLSSTFPTRPSHRCNNDPLCIVKHISYHVSLMFLVCRCTASTRPYRHNPVSEHVPRDIGTGKANILAGAFLALRAGTWRSLSS